MSPKAKACRKWARETLQASRELRDAMLHLKTFNVELHDLLLRKVGTEFYDEMDNLDRYLEVLCDGFGPNKHRRKPMKT